MTGYSVFLSILATKDIASVRRYIKYKSGSERIASRVVDRIFDRCERIGFVPFAGKPRDDLMPGLRTVPFEDKAVIAYLVSNKQVEVIRVFYGGRDWESFFIQPPPREPT